MADFKYLFYFFQDAKLQVCFNLTLRNVAVLYLRPTIHQLSRQQQLFDLVRIRTNDPVHDLETEHSTDPLIIASTSEICPPPPGRPSQLVIRINYLLLH